jgi:hypothetical protein
MTMPWKKTSDELESSAKVVDGNLILSLPDAINPIVWRMELGSVKASALEVKPQSTDGSFMLSLKTAKGEVHEIAPFQTRDQAVRALMRVSSALQGAHGKMAPVAMLSPAAPQPNIANDKTGGSAVKWLLTLGGVLIVIFLFAYLSSIAPRSTADGASGDATATNSATGEPDAESGMPQSADKLLRGY